MSTVSTEPKANEPAPESVEQRFRRLEAKWQMETAFISSRTVLCNHPAFLEIISLGDAVVPLMLRDIEKEPRLWVWALRQITGADPVPKSDQGNITKMGEAWLRWGREHGYR
jgi:hypothetical protein